MSNLMCTNTVAALLPDYNMPCAEVKLKYTPTVAELLPNFKIICPENDCNCVFQNRSHYQMHLTKHHKRGTLDSKTPMEIHCPVENCIYHVKRLGGRHFPTFKRLKQHYHKVHLEKTLKCNDCDKCFVTLAELETHKQSGNCGKKYVCTVCGWVYASKEALLTHARRKKHALFATEQQTNERLTKKRTHEPVEIPDYTIAKPGPRAKLPKIIPEQETSNAGTEFTYTDDLISSLLRDMQTQTDLQMQCNATTNTSQENLLPKQTGADMHTQTCAELDAELGIDMQQPIENPTAAANMYTQTCAELFAELGLSDIETQTNLTNTAAMENSMPKYTQTCEELLAELGLNDIETQTNFAADLATYDLHMPAGVMDFNTQYTQTCDALGTQQQPTTTDLVYATIGTNTPDFLATTNQQLECQEFPILNDCAAGETAFSTQQTQTCDELQLLYTSTIGTCMQKDNLLTQNSCDDFLISTETQTSFTLSDLDALEAAINTQSMQTPSPNAAQQTKLNYATTGTSTQEFMEATKCLQSDDFLVSTETQTSFTQCLLDSSLDNSNDNPALYNTQYTQTCEELLNELFGEQVSLQSTYTQTR